MIGRRWLRCGLLLAAAGAAGCAVGVRGRFQPTAGVRETDQERTAEAGVLLDINAEKQLSSNWRIRASDRSVVGVADQQGGLVDERRTSSLHQPSIDLFRTDNLWDFTLSAQRRSRSTNGEAADLSIVNDQFYGRVSYHPDGLPTLSAQTQYKTSKDNLFLDTSDLRSIFRIEHDIDNVNFFYEHAEQHTEDKAAGLDRDRTDNIARLLGSYFTEDGVLGVTLDLSHFDYTVEEQGLPVGPGVLPAMSGLYAVDSTPTVGALPANASLIDGDTTTGAGIQIGGLASGGGTDRNIGVDQGVVARQVQEIHVYTTVAFTAVEAGQFGWAVYTSADNLSWNLVTGSALYTYDISRRRFEIRVLGLGAQFLKVVNTSHAVGAGPVQVSEIQILGSEGTVALGSEERQDRANGTLQINPFDGLELFFEGGVGRNKRTVDGASFRDERNYQVSLGATVTPFDWLSVQGRASKIRQNDPLYLLRDVTAYTGTLDIEPNPNLNFQLSASTSDEKRDGLPFNTSDALFGRAAVILARDVEGSIQVSRTQQNNQDAGLQTERQFVLASIYAPLREDLEIRVDQMADFLKLKQVGGGSSRADTVMSGIESTWRPTDAFTLTVDWEYWYKAVQNAGFVQRYRFDWLPFPDGQLYVQLDYRRESGGVIRGTNEVALAQLRWKLERGAFLDLTATWGRREDQVGRTDRLKSLVLILNIEF